MGNTMDPTFLRVLRRDWVANDLAYLGAGLAAYPILVTVVPFLRAGERRVDWGLFLPLAAALLIGACLRVVWIRGLIRRGERIDAVLSSVLSSLGRTKVSYDYEFRGQKYVCNRSIRTRMTLKQGDPLAIVVDPDRPTRSVPVQLF